YDQLRPLSYPNTDVFLICFSVVNPASYHNVQEEWVTELKACMPRVPYILIGTQIDLRDDPKTLARLLHMKEKPMTYEQGIKLAKEEDYDQLRPLSYPNTDVFLICFSVVNPASYHNVQEEWVTELKACMPRVPYILIGTQIDLRDDPKTLARLLHMKEKPMTYEQGIKLAKEVGMTGYSPQLFNHYLWYTDM
ncbi:UNVERIFIED_CONTAM: hypothetical protein FKN15_007350, partial [Acipenser sinensis]